MRMVGVRQAVDENGEEMDGSGNLVERDVWRAKQMSFRTRKERDRVNKEFQLKIAVICLIRIITMTHGLLFFFQIFCFYRPNFGPNASANAAVVWIGNFMQNIVALLDLFPVSNHHSKVREKAFTVHRLNDIFA